MSYKIGSFNVRNLSWAGNKGRDLDMIASIIRRFDIVALQEVISGGKILFGASGKDPEKQAQAYSHSLKYRLGENWDMCWLDPKSSSKWYPYAGDSREEGYVFIWRTDKFVCPVNEKGEEIRPRIFRQYKTDKSNREMRLIRDPGYGRFQLVNMPNTEIRLINTHIVFGKPKGDCDAADADVGAAKMRKNEFNVLAKSVYTRIRDNHNDINCIVPYTIILGDYNLNLYSSGAGSPYVPEIVVIDQKLRIADTERKYENGFYTIYTRQTDFSTINKDGSGYSSNYDHFSYDDHTSSIVKRNPHRIDAETVAGDLETYLEKVSDHVPVKLIIDLK